jgi:hypothetical protein
MVNLINKKIKELYGSKALFCDKENHKYKDFASKLRTVQTKIDWLNKFLDSLNLVIEIKEKYRGSRKYKE